MFTRCFLALVVCLSSACSDASSTTVLNLPDGHAGFGGIHHIKISGGADSMVCFYEHRNFDGAHFCAMDGQGITMLDQFWNDRISSIQVGAGVKVIVCEHANFQGRCRDYRRDASILGVDEDNISSFRVVSESHFGSVDSFLNEEVCFYEHVDYQGEHFCVPVGEASNFVGLHWNDRISSIRVEGGVEVEVCEHADFQGWCWTYWSDTGNLGSRNDTISSFRVK